jgi:hypothetical protein
MDFTPIVDGVAGLVDEFGYEPFVHYATEWHKPYFASRLVIPPNEREQPARPIHVPNAMKFSFCEKVVCLVCAHDKGVVEGKLIDALFPIANGKIPQVAHALIIAKLRGIDWNRAFPHLARWLAELKQRLGKQSILIDKDDQFDGQQAESRDHGIALYDVAYHFEQDEEAAKALVRKWHCNKYISANRIGKCPRDGRKKLYRLSEIVSDITKALSLDSSEKTKLRQDLTAKLRLPR